MHVIFHSTMEFRAVQILFVYLGYGTGIFDVKSVYLGWDTGHF